MGSNHLALDVLKVDAFVAGPSAGLTRGIYNIFDYSTIARMMNKEVTFEDKQEEIMVGARTVLRDATKRVHEPGGRVRCEQAYDYSCYSILILCRGYGEQYLQ